MADPRFTPPPPRGTYSPVPPPPAGDSRPRAGSPPEESLGSEEPPPYPSDASAEGAAEGAPEGSQRGVSDFFRRAVSAGFDAASRSKNDILRVATGEIRSWLDRMDLDRELVKALQKLTLEVKAEVRFRPNDEGRLIPDAKAETRVRGPRTSGDE